MVNAVMSGNLLDGGHLYIGYSKSHEPELLPAATRQYAKNNPRDQIQYQGWDGEHYVVHIIPDHHWIVANRHRIPNFLDIYEYVPEKGEPKTD